MYLLFQIGALFFLAGLVWSMLLSFRFSKAAGIMNFLIWPLPYFLLLFSDFKKLSPPLLPIFAGIILMGLYVYLDPDFMNIYRESVNILSL